MLNEEDKEEVKKIIIDILEDRGIINRSYLGNFIEDFKEKNID